MAPALRVMRHGDGGLALFNGSKEESSSLIDIALTQAGRGGRGPLALVDGGFQRLQAGRSVVIVDCGAPPRRAWTVSRARTARYRWNCPSAAIG